jgi:hypothetical protein
VPSNFKGALFVCPAVTTAIIKQGLLAAAATILEELQRDASQHIVCCTTNAACPFLQVAGVHAGLVPLQCPSPTAT